MTSIDDDKYLLMKDCVFEISAFMIKHRVVLIISCFLSFLSQSCDIIIHNVLNFEQKKLWSTTKLHSLQAELKITHYDQQYLKSFALLIQQVLSISFLLFIDNFRIYRNIYQVMKTFYIISINLFYAKWWKIANTYTSILRLHNANSDDIINFFASEFQKLNKGLLMTINKQIQFVCAFVMAFTEDMF